MPIALTLLFRAGHALLDRGEQNVALHIGAFIEEYLRVENTELGDDNLRYQDLGCGHLDPEQAPERYFINRVHKLKDAARAAP